MTPPPTIHTLYPLDDSVYAGSIASWVGEYLKPAKNVELAAHARREGRPLDVQTKVDLPAKSLDHPQLPRLWAQARVNALLDQIAREGESKAAIDEIIRLSRRYKFVTPYTSLPRRAPLAAAGRASSGPATRSCESTPIHLSSR